jgi:hypothetical protein
MESFNDRLRRYTTGDDLEIFGWMTIMMQNYFLSELRAARASKLYVCVFLCTHAIIQTIAENMFGKKGKDGTRFYLESFVDGSDHDTRFSSVSDDIHEMRNTFAHQGYSGVQHRVELNDEMAEGWKTDSGNVFINPAVYADHFEEAFRRGAHVELYRRSFSDKERTIRKYKFIRNWLGLDRANPIAREIKRLEACTTTDDYRVQEAVIQGMIFRDYAL